MRQLPKYYQRKIKVYIQHYAIPRLFSRLTDHAYESEHYYLGGIQYGLLFYKCCDSLGSDDTTFKFDKWTLHLSTSQLVEIFGEEVFNRGVHIVPDFENHSYINSLKMELYDEAIENI